MKTLEIIETFSDIVASTEHVTFSEDEGITQFKAKLRLVDTSVIWIREIRKRDVLIAYSYYWLKSDNSIIIGWDNAPHHPEIETFPHHKHIGSRNESSYETDLFAVLQFIRDLLA